jgi:hypothetical protein
MMDDSFPLRLEKDSEEKITIAWQTKVVLSWENIHPFSPRNNQQQNMMMQFNYPPHHNPKSTNNQYRFHLEAYNHLINFAESDPKVSSFLGSLLNDNLQKMVELTT